MSSEAVRALDQDVALAVREQRLRLVFSGPDRAKCLHNLCTNEVRKLAVGQGREAFVTSLQGKTLAFVTLLAEAERIWLRTDSASSDALVTHLTKYSALEDVAIDDHTAKTFEIHLAGPRAHELLSGFPGHAPASDLALGALEIDGTVVRLVREEPLGRSGLTLIGPIDERDRVVEALDHSVVRTTGAPLPRLSADEVEGLRIAAGTPASGRDVTEKNLPQEVGRDDRAISFVKGCYLGQETVARLDALGHVNRMLQGLDLDGDEPPATGTSLTSGSKDAGWMTSSARSARTGRPIALAYVRTAFLAEGTSLTWQTPDGVVRTAIVRGLPIPGA